jgi:hypothetical protein
MGAIGGILMLYRVKQFIGGVRAKLTSEDVYFIDKYLDEKEKGLFYRIPRYEQVHSVKVAREVINESLKENVYDIYLVKAALLHDIGKIDGGLNLLTKSVMVLMERFTPGLLKRLRKMRAVNTYYNHPEIALSYLGNGNEYLLYLIKNHHNYDISADEKLEILQRADCNN